MNNKDFDSYCIVAYDVEGSGVELYHDNECLELIAKLSATEVHYAPTWKWPCVNDDNDYLMVMPYDQRHKLSDWHNEYPGGKLLIVDG